MSTRLLWKLVLTSIPTVVIAIMIVLACRSEDGGFDLGRILVVAVIFGGILLIYPVLEAFF